MPDISITITVEEVLILESYYNTAEDGVKDIVRRRIKSFANNIINKSESKFDPNKLTVSELRNEIRSLAESGKIKTKKEK